MRIGEDKAQQANKHEVKHHMLAEMGHELVPLPVPVGDYIEITSEIQEVIDRRGASHHSLNRSCGPCTRNMEQNLCSASRKNLRGKLLNYWRINKRLQ